MERPVKSFDDLESTQNINFSLSSSGKRQRNQLISVKVDSINTELRYRKARNKLGGNERDHWKEENLIHMVSSRGNWIKWIKC